MCPSTRYAAGAQGIFPIAHRGWAYSGYNADGRVNDPIDQSAFEFKQEDYPTSEPTGFDDTGNQDPAQGAAFSFVPSVRDPSTPNRLGDRQDAAVARAQGQPRRRCGLRLLGAHCIRPSRRRCLGRWWRGPGDSARGCHCPGVRARCGHRAGQWLVRCRSRFGLLDYTDVNGDGFPDVVAPGSSSTPDPAEAIFPGNGPACCRAGHDVRRGRRIQRVRPEHQGQLEG